MSYTDFGLDETKKLKDPGNIGKSRCIWCNKTVNEGFSMCFSNFVICQRCSITATNVVQNERWEEAESCFKCYKKDVIGFRTYPGNMPLHICKDCVDWSKEQYRRREKTKLITERTTTMTTQEILQQCTVDGYVVKLPNIQLEYTTEYVPVKKKLELIGGKWKAAKIQGFVFEEDPTALLAALAAGEKKNPKKEFQFFGTPPDLADYIITKVTAETNLFEADQQIKILEPSAGDGSLVKAINRHNPDLMVDCFELMDLNWMKLAKVPGAVMLGDDFLKAVDEKKILNTYDLIIANPPFSKNQDIDHIMAMYECTKVGGYIITIASKSWTFGSQKKQVKFKNWLEEINAVTEEIMPGSFKDSGTLVGAMIIMIQKRGQEDKVFQEVVTAPPIVEPAAAVTYEPQEYREPAEILEEIKSSTLDALSIIESLQKDLTPELTINPDDMNFFRQLSGMLGDSELTLTIRKKGDDIVVVMMPKNSAKSDSLNSLKPLVLSGSPEIADASFFDTIREPMEKVTTLVTNAVSVSQQADKVETKVKEAKPKKAEKEKPQKDIVIKPDPKPVEPKKEPEPKKPVIPQVSMFEMEAANG